MDYNVSSGLREEAVALVNQAKLATDADEKVTALTQLQELIIHRAIHTALVTEILPAVLEFQIDRHVL